MRPYAADQAQGRRSAVLSRLVSLRHFLLGAKLRGGNIRAAVQEFDPELEENPRQACLCPTWAQCCLTEYFICRAALCCCCCAPALSVLCCMLHCCCMLRLSC